MKIEWFFSNGNLMLKYWIDSLNEFSTLRILDTSRSSNNIFIFSQFHINLTLKKNSYSTVPTTQNVRNASCLPNNNNSNSKSLNSLIHLFPISTRDMSNPRHIPNLKIHFPLHHPLPWKPLTTRLNILTSILVNGRIAHRHDLDRHDNNNRWFWLGSL